MLCSLRWLCSLGVVLLLGPACDRDEAIKGPEPTGTVVSRRDLTEERANVVLAKVGDRAITLGDYVSALERMDSFDRLRYQTKERRKLLLDEMIDVELLAREAERQGIDKEPETQAYLRQLMREEVLRQLRDAQPRADQVPASEVRSYYEAHPEEFADPERRRVAVIALKDEKTAQAVLEEVQGADGKRWGTVARARSVLPKATEGTPLEFEGDLGLTSSNEAERGQNVRVPKEVREALFTIDEPGAVHPKVVPAEGRFYVVRLLSKSPARQRTLEEADTVIRVRLVKQRVEQAERALEEELRKKYPVTIDEAALAQLKLPEPGPQRGESTDPMTDATAPASSRSPDAPTSAEMPTAAPSTTAAP